MKSIPAPEICRVLLNQRYLAPGETTHDDVFRRVAHALAAPERVDQRARCTRRIYANLIRGAIGAGRIMANAGTRKDATMVNCFVHPIVAPGVRVASPESVSLALTQACRTLRMGGGVGYDFSAIAPVGARTHAAGTGIGGVCAVIERFDVACRSLPLPDTRGGAQMAVLRCDHPDLEDFVSAKRGRRRWATFNVSVAVTDDFMTAVECDTAWPLRHAAPPDAQRLANGARLLADGDWCYTSVPARRLWQRIVEAARDSAEPGLLFIDTIRRANDLADIESIDATNPCGEQPLPSWGSCVLGPIDLARRVRRPFAIGGSPAFDFVELGRLVHTQVRMLDNAIDITKWPLQAHEVEARSKRRIGVGVTALGDTLTMMGLRYDSQAARELASAIGRCLRDNAYAASAALAAERGAYPLFRVERSLSPGHFASALPEAVRDLIARHGLRNSHLLSFAPTGSVSLAFCGNCSSGIEPAFDWVYRRRLRLSNDPQVLPRDYLLENRAYRIFRELRGDRVALPESFATAAQIDGLDHLRMLAALQPFVDGGISKTVPLAPNASAEQVAALFRHAWRAGLKGVTVFRLEAADAVMHTLTPSHERPICDCGQ